MNFSDLKKDLASYASGKIVFVGLGNQLRQDDAAGLIITEKIDSSKVFNNAAFILAQTTPENYLNQILQYTPDLVVFIDAADWGASPGEMSWIASSQIENLAISTHTYAISLIEKYLKLNADLDVKYLIIQPYSMDYGTSLSNQLEKRIKQFII